MYLRSLLAEATLACWIVGMATTVPCSAQLRALPPNVATTDYAPTFVPTATEPPEVSLASRMFDAGRALQPTVDALPADRVDRLTVAANEVAWSPASPESWSGMPPVETSSAGWGESLHGGPSSQTRYLQVLPDGLMYPAYLAGQRESRMASQWVHLKDVGWMWDSTLGGRAGILRWGTDDPLHPEGWQLDVEGAAFPRLDVDNDRDMVSTDFRFGVPLTARRGSWEYKFGYYHLCSHLGDEYMVRNSTLERINYVRDCLVAGIAMRPLPDIRLYGEAAWAFYLNGGAEPWEFQFGVDYGSTQPTGVWGSPFAAINGHLREEIDFSGNICVQAGWQWRGPSGHLFRTGLQYFNGKSIQYQFYDTFEEQIGAAIWYDY